MYSEIYSLLGKVKKLDSYQLKRISNNPSRDKVRLESSIEEGKDILILEFSFTTTTEEPPHLKSNLKFLIKTERRLCFIIRLDLREAHLNPSIDDIDGEILEELESLKKSNQIVADLYRLMEKYEEYFFEREKGHVHIFINDWQNCDQWAIPIEEFISFLESHFYRKVGEINFYTKIGTSLKTEVKIANILNFLRLINFELEQEFLEAIKHKLLGGR